LTGYNRVGTLGPITPDDEIWLADVMFPGNGVLFTFLLSDGPGVLRPLPVKLFSRATWRRDDAAMRPSHKENA
jgi:hypothetical protein